MSSVRTKSFFPKTTVAIYNGLCSAANLWFVGGIICDSAVLFYFFCCFFSAHLWSWASDSETLPPRRSNPPAGRQADWTGGEARGFLLPSVSWPQLWVIRETIAIPLSSHLISRRPRRRIFCQALLPAHLELRGREKEERENKKNLTCAYTEIHAAALWSGHWKKTKRNTATSFLAN